MSGFYDIVIAAGVESMSRVPMLSNVVGQDPLGSEIAARYPAGLVNQGISAELIAANWKLDRRTLDEFAARSHQLAAAATAAGDFDAEIVPVQLTGANGTPTWHRADETIRATTSPESLADLKPAFRGDPAGDAYPQIDWSITAGNASPLTDGASAVLIMGEDTANQLGLRPRARFHSFSVIGDDPVMMLTGIIPATRMALERTGLSIDDIDVFEVNEAFASVPLAWLAEVGADPAKLNQRGGAIALGHALGASGGRILATMLGVLESTGGRYGLQTMCEGGGMANCTIIERL
jgi:acetyl-CoA acyltransferase